MVLSYQTRWMKKEKGQFLDWPHLLNQGLD
jgi:hypothetical protein